MEGSLVLPFSRAGIFWARLPGEGAIAPFSHPVALLSLTAVARQTTPTSQRLPLTGPPEARNAPRVPRALQQRSRASQHQQRKQQVPHPSTRPCTPIPVTPEQLSSTITPSRIPRLCSLAPRCPPPILRPAVFCVDRWLPFTLCAREINDKEASGEHTHLRTQRQR